MTITVGVKVSMVQDTSGRLPSPYSNGGGQDLGIKDGQRGRVIMEQVQ